MDKVFWGVLGFVLVVIGGLSALDGDAAATIYCCFGAHVCIDNLKEADGNG